MRAEASAHTLGRRVGPQLLPLQRREDVAAAEQLLLAPLSEPPPSGLPPSPLGLLAPRAPPFRAAAALLDADATVGDAAPDGELRAEARRLNGAHELRAHAASTARDAAAAQAARALERAGVRLLLARGAIDAELCACCASKGILAVAGVGVRRPRASEPPTGQVTRPELLLTRALGLVPPRSRTRCNRSPSWPHAGPALEPRASRRAR